MRERPSPCACGSRTAPRRRRSSPTRSRPSTGRAAYDGRPAHPHRGGRGRVGRIHGVDPGRAHRHRRLVARVVAAGGRAERPLGGVQGRPRARASGSSTTRPPLVLSPVVIAMWEPMAKALGWPEQPLGWSEMAALRHGGRGLVTPRPSRVGRVQVRPHPSALQQLGRDRPGGRDLRRRRQVARPHAPKTCARAAPFVKRVQADVVHYGRSTGFFADEDVHARPRATSPRPCCTRTWSWRARSDPRYRRKPFPVVAVYPREGTFWSDHPYAILDLPGVTPEVREAAEALPQAFLIVDRAAAARRCASASVPRIRSHRAGRAARRGARRRPGAAAERAAEPVGGGDAPDPRVLRAGEAPGRASPS